MASSSGNAKPSDATASGSSDKGKDKFARVGGRFGQNVGERKRENTLGTGKRRRKSRLATGTSPTDLEKKLLKLVQPSYYLETPRESNKSVDEPIGKEWVDLMAEIDRDNVEDQALFLFQLTTTQEEDMLIKIMTVEDWKCANILRRWIRNAVSEKQGQGQEQERTPHQKRVYKELLIIILDVLRQLPVTSEFLRKGLKDGKVNKYITSGFAQKDSLSQEILGRWQVMRSFWEQSSRENGRMQSIIMPQYEPCVQYMSYKQLLDKYGEKKKNRIGDSYTANVIHQPELYKQSRKIPLPLSRVSNLVSKPDVDSKSKERIADSLAAQVNKGKQKAKIKSTLNKQKMIVLGDQSHSKKRKRVKEVRNSNPFSKPQPMDILGARLKKKKVQTIKGKMIRTDPLLNKGEHNSKSTTSGGPNVTSSSGALERTIRWGDALDAPKTVNETYGGWGLKKFHACDQIAKKFVVGADNSTKWHKPRMMKKGSLKETDAVDIENRRIEKAREIVYLNHSNIPRTPVQNTSTPTVSITRNKP